MPFAVKRAFKAISSPQIPVIRYQLIKIIGGIFRNIRARQRDIRIEDKITGHDRTRFVGRVPARLHSGFSGNRLPTVEIVQIADLQRVQIGSKGVDDLIRLNRHRTIFAHLCFRYREIFCKQRHDTVFRRHCVHIRGIIQHGTIVDGDLFNGSDKVCRQRVIQTPARFQKRGFLQSSCALCHRCSDSKAVIFSPVTDRAGEGRRTLFMRRDHAVRHGYDAVVRRSPIYGEIGGGFLVDAYADIADGDVFRRIVAERKAERKFVFSRFHERIVFKAERHRVAH